MTKKDPPKCVIATYMVKAPITVTEKGGRIDLKPGQRIRALSLTACTAVMTGHLKRVPGSCVSHVEARRDTLDQVMESDYVDRWRRLGFPATVRGYPRVKKADKDLNKTRNSVLDGKVKLHHFVNALDRWETEIRRAILSSGKDKATNKRGRKGKSDTK